MVCIIVPGAGLGASELVGMLAVKGLKVQKSDRCYEVNYLTPKVLSTLVFVVAAVFADY